MNYDSLISNKKAILSTKDNSANKLFELNKSGKLF